MLLHGAGTIGWHDWPWFAAFAAVMLAAWWLLRRYGKRWGNGR